MLRSLKASTQRILLITLIFITVSCRARVENIPQLEPAPVTDRIVETEKSDLTLAIVFPLMHPFFEQTRKGVREKAEELSVNVVLMGPRDFSVEEQIGMMEKLIDSGVDGIGIGAFDPKALSPVIDRATENGIPVVCFDTDAPQSSRLSFISTDNWKQGRQLGRLTAEALKGEGKIIVSQGVPTQLNLNQRLKGLRETLSSYPGIEILEVSSGYGNSEKTVASIEAMIEAHPDFDALVGLDAEAGPSAILVWKSRGLRQHLIVSEDMPETIKGIRDGIVSVTIAQEQYRWGTLVVRRLIDSIRGIPLEEFEMTSTRIINKENVDLYY